MIMASDIAGFLKKKLNGRDLEVNSYSSLENITNNTLCFFNEKKYDVRLSCKALIIVNDNYIFDQYENVSYICSENPRLDYIKVLNKFFLDNKIFDVAETVKIGKGCKIGNDIKIGDYTVIKDNVSIGDGTIINSHVLIESNTIIGNDCYIKSGAVIGEDGFGFERDEDGVPLRFPHIGNVIIGNNVEIGAKTTIARGTLGSTIIKDNVKIDDQVHIAHNCMIDENVLLTACVEVSGSVIIGKNSWVGPNSSIKNGVKIGNNSFIGIACNVSEDLNKNEKIGSFSNLSLRHIVKLKKVLNEK